MWEFPHLKLGHRRPLLLAGGRVSGEGVGQHQRVGAYDAPDVTLGRLGFLPGHGHLIQDQEVVVGRPDGSGLGQEGRALEHQGHRHGSQGHQVETESEWKKKIGIREVEFI